MKKKSTKSSARTSASEPADEDIRNYAYRLFEQRGGEPGHDIDDWLEARAWLRSSVPGKRAHVRSPVQLTRPYPDLAAEESDEVRHMNT
jgi:hypothetical protein